jgi:predicted O-methyltransferase YrrM
MTLRDSATREFFRHRAVRRLVAATRRSRYDLAHLATFDESGVGPVQPDEALLLHGLVRALRPETVVEIGFLLGHSALNFLSALDADARLYSFDIDPQCERLARERFGQDRRFAFRRKSQTELEPADIDGRAADFVFLDAAHELDLNQATFARLLPMLSPRAIIAVHDTGTWPRRFVPAGHWWLGTDDGWIGDEREVMPGERAFVNWLLDEHPQFAQLHVHSTRTARYGLTLLQVEPNWAMETVTAAPARASGVSPGPSCPNSRTQRSGSSVVSRGCAPGALSTATTT